MTRIALLLLALLAVPVPAQEAEVAPPLPVLVTKSDAAFVHALRHPRTPHALGSRRAQGDRYDLLFTDRETGAMKRLIEPTGAYEVPTRRVSYRVLRLVGVAADEERLYVALWRSGRVFDRPASADAPMEGGRYELLVFWLVDGSQLEAPPLDPEECPKSAPPESVGAGPLKLLEDGVECYGATGRYDRETLRDE